MKIFISSLVVAAALTAAVPASSEEATIWVRTSSASILEKLAGLYNESHDDTIKVVPIVAEQMVPKLGAALAGGSAPEAAALDLIYVPTFAVNNTLEDISDFIDSKPYAASLSPSHIRLASYEGKKYGVPFLPDASVIAYNTDLFSKAGIDAKEAFSSVKTMAAAADKISALGNDTYGFYFVANSGSWLIYDFMPHIWAAGADILSDDGREATVDTEAMRDTLAAYNDMWTAGAIHPTSRSGNGNSAVEAFASGKVGILMSGSYIVNLLTNKFPDVNFDIAKIPGPKGGVSSFAGGDTISLMSGISDDKKALMLDFIDFYLQPDMQVLITEESGMPSRIDLAEEAYKNFDKRNLIAYEALGDGRTPYTFSSDELFVSRTGPFLNLIQTAIFEGDIDGAISKAQGDFQKILDRTNP